MNTQPGSGADPIAASCDVESGVEAGEAHERPSAGTPLGIEAGQAISPWRGRRTWRLRARTSGLETFVRLALWSIASALDGAVLQVRTAFVGPAAGSKARSDFARRMATRTGRLLGTLKGAFAKAGQFAAIRHDILPAEASQPLAELRDRVPALPLAQLLPLLRSELGPSAASASMTIDPHPIGAASIAQAHRARLADGSEVVIKIQYPWIAEASPRDLRVLRRLGRALLRLSGRHPDAVDFDRLFDEFANGLTQELDFAAEARAAAEIADNLADLPGVVVPTIHPELSTRRVLTMSFEPCVRVDDRAGLARLGVRAADVLQILAHAYAKQVFLDGLFHADPHPGNLFVLETPDAAKRPRVLFVDFGLCRRLSPELRSAMRQGIYAVLQRDLDAFLARMDDMDMIAPGAEPGVRAAVAAMFERLESTGRAGGMLGASSGGVLALKDEAKRLLQDTPGLQLPNDLLLYAKTLSYLFALGESLDPDADLMQISLPYLLKFLATTD